MTTKSDPAVYQCPFPKVDELEKLATNLIEDGQKPDMFFVFEKGVVVAITRDFDPAHRLWQLLSSCEIECELKNRTFGLIASIKHCKESPTGIEKILRINEFLNC